MDSRKIIFSPQHRIEKHKAIIDCCEVLHHAPLYGPIGSVKPSSDLLNFKGTGVKREFKGRNNAPPEIPLI